MNKKYYVYLHKRLDKNEIFYVGKGTLTGKKGQHRNHSRAYCKKGRSSFWYNITNKTPYEVIIFDYFEKEDDCLEAEINLIKQYGYIKNGSGTLCNLSSGGESGQSGVKQSKSQINKRIAHIEKPVCCYDFEGNFIKEYKSCSEAMRIFGKSINESLRNKQISAHGYLWVFKGQDVSLKVNKIKDKWGNLKTKVYQYSKDKTTLIATFKSIKEASNTLKIQYTSIRENCLNQRKSAGGFYFSYVELTGFISQKYILQHL